MPLSPKAQSTPNKYAQCFYETDSIWCWAGGSSEGREHTPGTHLMSYLEFNLIPQGKGFWEKGLMRAQKHCFQPIWKNKGTCSSEEPRRSFGTEPGILLGRYNSSCIQMSWEKIIPIWTSFLLDSEGTLSALLGSEGTLSALLDSEGTLSALLDSEGTLSALLDSKGTLSVFSDSDGTWSLLPGQKQGL